MATSSTRHRLRLRHCQAQTRLLPLQTLFSLIAVLCVLLQAHSIAAVTDDEAEAVQQWRLDNQLFDWQQIEPNSSVHIDGAGAEDVDGNLYFAGIKAYQNESIDDQNLFVACLNADGSIRWTREFGTEELDGANFIAIVNETAPSGIDGEPDITTEILYVVGWTWGFMDEGNHALNGFGRFGGRDVVLIKMSLDGEKLWTRQFGTTANDFGYGVALDGSFQTILLSGTCVTDQIDEMIEVAIDDILEPRQDFAMYEPQIMDPHTRTSSRQREYAFAVSLNSNGDILDFAMDGGITLTPRRRRISEDGVVAEYTVVLNRQPLEDVTIYAEDVRLVDASGDRLQQLQFLSSQNLTFTRGNWNREQVIRVAALDDAIAEGTHYSTITHRSASRDPNFDGFKTPFLYGSNVTVQILDNDVAGISISRRHVFVGEGGAVDNYTIVLRSQPWYPVIVQIVPLHTNQTIISPTSVVFQPYDWNVSQTIVVSAVDDTLSENEFGGLHSGGEILHFSESRDPRYHSRRPACFDVTVCDPSDPLTCVFDDSSFAPDSIVRVCDVSDECDFVMSNGACVSLVNTVDAVDGVVPPRFGNRPLDPSVDTASEGDTEVALSYSELRSILMQQATDRNLSMVTNASEFYEFADPPPELKGFVLSFLGLLNMEQVRQLRLSPSRTLRTICGGVMRLETMRWGFEEWPRGYTERVLDVVFQMFPDISPRHVWNCGMAVFQPGSAIGVTVLDNDPGITLSTDTLSVKERAATSNDNDNCAEDEACAMYTIVLNAPPVAEGRQPVLLRQSICSVQNSNVCGWWSDFASFASTAFDTTHIDEGYVSVAVVGNAQLSISPSIVTFTTQDWFVPQMITVYALDDAIAEQDALFAISHRVQSSTVGYSDLTPFWIRDELLSAHNYFPTWHVDNSLPYNTAPTVLHSPNHRHITISIRDDDTPGVNVLVKQPHEELVTKEALDNMDWIGDYVTALGFSDVSMASMDSPSDVSLSLEDILIFAPNSTTYMKFHLPQFHSGDTQLEFSSAKLQLFQTPYKIFNVSDHSTGSTPSDTEDSSFAKVYHARVTAIMGDWTVESIVSKVAAKPMPLSFLSDPSVDVSAAVEKSRSLEIDVTPLVSQVLSTRLPVLSLQIDVLYGSANASNSATQLCSSKFERSLKPRLLLEYRFPNLLLGASATQSSSAIDVNTSEVLSASLATDGDHYLGSKAMTDHETEPWWEASLSKLHRIGTLAVFLPEPQTTDSELVSIVIIASAVPFEARALPLNDALVYGCPENCPRSQRFAVRRAVLIWDVQAGIQAVRIYRVGSGALEIAEVEAFGSYVSVTPTSDGKGIRSRLKSDWTSSRTSDSWRLLQTVRDSEEENLASRMPTRQSSTSPNHAYSFLAVDGEREHLWDPTVLLDSNASRLSTTGIADMNDMEAGSTRTEIQTDPWWEVDLGEVVPISSIAVFPFIGEAGHDFCGDELASAQSEAQIGDLYAFTRTDRLLQLETPFLQHFEILVSDVSLYGVNAATADIAASSTLAFSCQNDVRSVVWRDVFAKGRFVTVRKQGNETLMLNEVEVYRWNPTTTPQYILLDLFGSGNKAMALTRVEIFPPASAATLSDGAPGYALPIAYTIHSKSSERATSGAGSTAVLSSLDTSQCYISASASSAHEWIVLALETPTRVGYIEIESDVTRCGDDVQAVEAVSIGCYGSNLDGIVSDMAPSGVSCAIDPSGRLLDSTGGCDSYVCRDTLCNSETVAQGTTATLQMNHFVDSVALGKLRLAPTIRLPLSENEHRALVMRDNPAELWFFDEQPSDFVAERVVANDLGRLVSALVISEITDSKILNIDDAREQTFFSNSIMFQQSLSSFTLEFWIQLLGTFSSQQADSSFSIVSLYGGGSGQINFGGVSVNADALKFQLEDPSTGDYCRVETRWTSAESAEARWNHVAASYSPSTASITISVRSWNNDVSQASVEVANGTSRCSLAMLAMTQKSLQFGMPAHSASTAGFKGEIANVAWYPDELKDRVLLDHFHDFFDGVTKESSSSHNIYSLQLSSRPASRVTIDINAENGCYLFNVCNTSVYPSVLEFLPENWAKPHHIRVLATDDDLFEGFHYNNVTHAVSTAETYQLVSRAHTTALQEVMSGDSTTFSDSVYKGITKFFKDRILKNMDSDSDDSLEQQQLLDEYHDLWRGQHVVEEVISSMVYGDALAIRSVRVSVLDLTVPGIEFSTSSLTVSEDGKGNDYQVVLLSEPKEIVIVTLDSETDCYRECFQNALCPSQSASRLGGDSIICGDGQNGMLCNVSVTPEVLYFSGTNWSIPQTVRVIAIDDMLDEADLHITAITTSSVSLDPVYHALDLPDIAVFVEDNDDTDILYSTKNVRLSESDAARINGSNATGFDYRGQTNYALSLATEPWANVTIAMSNEADRSCYRECGYPFDLAACGLPRQQSASLVRLGTNSSLEKHEIKITIPRVVELQRIVTSCNHIDQIFRLQIVGGYAQEIQTVTFAFNSDFKRTYRTSREIIAAVNYGRTFRLGMTGRTGYSAVLDGFSSPDTMATALNSYLGGGQYVSISREITFEQNHIRWTVTFTRLLSSDKAFPLLTAAMSTPFEGTLTVARVQSAAGPTGTYQLRYGSGAEALPIAVPLDVSAANLNALFSSLSGVLESSVSSDTVTDNYGVGFLITLKRVSSYRQLEANVSGLTSATGAAIPAAAIVVQTQAPAAIGGSFVIEYVSPFTSLKIVNKTNPIPWNASAEFVASEISEMTGLGRVTSTSQSLTPEGGRQWDVLFAANNGNISSLTVRSANLTGPGVRVYVETVRDGESLGGSFAVQMGGLFKRIDPETKHVFSEQVPMQVTSSLAYNATAGQVQKALLDRGITGETHVTRQDLDCDDFLICNGYSWMITYANSPGNLPPIQVLGNITGKNATIAARTVANGTFLGGSFTLTLELLDIDTNVLHVGKTWPLPVSVSAVGMDEALEALPFVRSNREEEYDPETRGWRGIKFDKGVRVYRDGPFLDGGYTWRLEWALQDYIRFEDLRITVNTSRVTQETDPMQVESEFADDGTPRCETIANAHFEKDKSDFEGSRGFCVYDIVNTTVQERFLCNYTVVNPWIVYSPHDWCLPQYVELEVVNDWVDEQTIRNGNVTYSNVTHTIFSDDMIYVNFRADSVEVAVANDDVAKVLVSERLLEVSEDGERVANYTLQLNSEPLYTVRVVVLPWLDNNQTLCYRFGLCNVTIPVDEYTFTPRNWNVPQYVRVLATDDNLDEYDVHWTGISHVSYSDDIKYNEIAIPKINVMVYDNDVSAFKVLKTQVNVTEGGAIDEYAVVLMSEPFAKVTVTVTNVGTKGNYAIPTPSQLVFTWLDWNQSQAVRVEAFDDRTQDPLTSSSLLVHSIASNDLIYAKLRDLTAVTVSITDNDQSGIELSHHSFSVPESNLTAQMYRVRLTSEPWYPVVLIPNANHGCYQRQLTMQSICNVTMLTNKVHFGAGNWSTWVNVSFLAVDDWLTEAPVHKALITHSTTSNDPLYDIANYSALGGDVVVSITDNDVSFVNIALQVPGGNQRSLLNVAEGGFNDSYRISLASEPYAEVRLKLTPSIDTIMNIENNVSSFAPQVGVTFESSSSVGATVGTVRSVELVFTCVDWARAKVVNVMAIDDTIPEAATQYTLIHHSILSADPAYNTSSRSIGIMSVNVSISDRETISPPLPISAILDGSGSRIDVVFDSTVYHAATMDYSITSGVNTTATRTVRYVIRLKSFACGLVFDLSASTYSLGKSASCVWIDFTQIRIQLSAGTTISPNDILVLNPCNSFADQYCQATSVLRARYTSRAYSQGSVTVKAPVVVITPTPILMVPDEVGNCGGWSVDASISTGGGGRPFTSTTWFAVPSTLLSAQESVTAATALQSTLAMYAQLASLCAKYASDWQTGKSSLILVPLSDVNAANVPLLSTMAQLRSVCYLRSISQNATSTRSLQLNVDNTLVESGAAYLVGLELTNAFGERSVQMKRIAVRSLAAPLVYAVGESVVNITRTSELLVLQVAVTASCSSMDMSAVKYRWIVTSQSATGVGLRTENLNSLNVAKNPRSFRISRNALEGGRQYTFRAEAYFADSSFGSAASASIVVNVGVSIPVVEISGGSRSIGVKEYLVLTGSAVDPDGSVLPFQYTWSCQDITNSTNVSPCMNSSRNASLDLSSARSLNLSVAPFLLAPNRTLVFSLSVSKSGQAATASTSIWTVAASGPTVAISTPTVKINPSATLRIVATVSSEYPSTARWTQEQGDLNMSASMDTNPAFALPLTSPSNVILKNALTAGLTYVLRLVATDINGNVGFGSVTIHVNTPPASGTFVVSPRSGYAITDTFTLTCADWTDDVSDFPLTYSFAAITTTTFESILAEVTDSSSFALKLVKMSTPLVTVQSAPTAIARMLPPALTVDSENVTIVALIRDALGAIAIAHSSVEVILPAEAKSQPMAFVSSMLDSSAMSDTDGSQKVKKALSAAMVVRTAFASEPGCQSSASTGVCSSHGVCDSSSGKCFCDDGYLGPLCQFDLETVQSVNSAILTTLSSSAQTIDPTSSGLSQQAMVLETMVQSTPTALSEGDLSDLTDVTSDIAGNAFSLSDPQDFFDSGSDTIVSVMSGVVSIGSTTTAQTASTGRRRLSSAETSCGETSPDTAALQATYRNIIQSLQTISSLASQDLLEDEPASVISSDVIDIYSTVGSKLLASTEGGLSVNLTDVAVACLSSDLFVNAFTMKTPIHSDCSITDVTPISKATVVTVHSQAAFDSATAGTNSIELQYLDSSSTCVKREAAAASSTRRLDTSNIGAAATIQWQPLLVVSIPHERALSAIEQRNFSTACRVWNSDFNEWGTDICFKDASESTVDSTVCYCSAIGKLEVLITLEETLDFYALSRDLYRDDPLSISPSIAVIVVVALCALAERAGKRLDARDVKRMKDLVIRKLNRSKWTELETRTQAVNIFDDFDAYCARKKLEKDQEQTIEKTGATEATTVGSVVAGSGRQTAETSSVAATPMAAAMTVISSENADIELPDETRILFESSSQIGRQYARVTQVFRLCNAVLVILGLVLAFAGIDFVFVLGNTTTELLVFVYGKPLGIVVAVFGGALVISGSAGMILAKKDGSHVARRAYVFWLSLILIVQLTFIAGASNYLSSFQDLPQGLFKTLKHSWDALSTEARVDIESMYGCCGFGSIKEETACPEEALEAYPPRVCFAVLKEKGREFFSDSFLYVGWVFLAEVASIAVANVLVKWRRLRLLQLAGEPASSVAGTRSADRSMLSSQTTVILMASLPSIYYLFGCVTVTSLFYGVDLLLPLNFVSSELVSALFGLELGVLAVVASTVHLLILVKGIHALQVRDAQGLKWFIWAYIAFIFPSLVTMQYFWSLEENFQANPVITEALQSKYLSIPQSRLAMLESAMQCCGFTSNAQGTCLVGDTPLPTCQVMMEHTLLRGVSLLSRRLEVFVAAEVCIVLLSAILWYRIRRYTNHLAIAPQPTERELAQQSIPVRKDTKLWVLAAACCNIVLVLLNLVGLVVGLFIVLVGIDALVQLNVLQISYFVRAFDRHVGIYVTSFGGFVEVFSFLGLLAAVLRSRKLLYLYAWVALGLFLASFAGLGIVHRANTVLSSNPKVAHYYIGQLWANSPSQVKQFAQNKFTCCGYDRVVSSNGSVSFTYPAETVSWQQETTTTTTRTYSTLASSHPIPSSWTTRSLSESTVSLVQRYHCPEGAEDGCSSSVLKYLLRTTQYADIVLLVVAPFTVLAALCTMLMLMHVSLSVPDQLTQPIRWKLKSSRLIFVLLAFGCVFSALTCLLLGLDIATKKAVFSSPLLQLLFSRSVGVALVFFAVVDLSLNFYAAQGAISFTVHRIFMNGVGRALLSAALWIGVGLTGYLSRFSASPEWREQLVSYLDYRWNTLSPTTQLTIGMAYSCCGFNDPVLVSGQGVVFDRPPAGFSCSLANSRGCRGVLVDQVSESFSWLFQYLLGLALVESVAVILAVVMVRELMIIKQEEWFRISSRIRFAVGKFRSQAHKTHVVVSVYATFDPKLTRAQRIVCVLAALMTTLAIYTSYFSTQGCSRTALKTCEQPSIWAVLGMGLLYGGFAGYASQTVCRALFELVRNRSDDETKEIAVTRQRKEKVLLFKDFLQRRGFTPSTNRVNINGSAGTDATGSGHDGGPARKLSFWRASSSRPSSMETSQTTTEERWYNWIAKFLFSFFQFAASVQFVVACGVATLMGLLILSRADTLYNVKIDKGPRESLFLAIGTALTSVVAWIAVDQRDRRYRTSCGAFITVAIASVVLVIATMLGIYMMYQVLDDVSDPATTDGDSEVMDNWTIRSTGFSIVRRLEEAWKAEAAFSLRNSAQQQLQCCGFRNASDYAFRPCPSGTIVQVDYEAQLVNGTVVTKSQNEEQDLSGCLPAMVVRFERMADGITYFAIAMCIIEFAMAASAVFLVHDLMSSRDAKLKMRVPKQLRSGSVRDVRQTFEKVVGLKIAAPARGKILSSMLASSLDNVAPRIATELATVPLSPAVDDIGGDDQAPRDATTALAAPFVPKSLLEPTFARKRGGSKFGDGKDIADRVPYPASVVYVVFAVAGAWIFAMGYLVVVSSTNLGSVTAWYCLMSWAIGVIFQWALVEPGVIFLMIVVVTLRDWWSTTLVARALHHGRSVLRIQPDAATLTARYYASLSLYERIRYNAAVRIQRRLLTLLTRQRFLRKRRELKQQQQRHIGEQRRATLKKTIESFTEEETTAFSLIFRDSDTAQLGLVPYTVISHSIYQLGVNVPSSVVHQSLTEFDPAYSDLVDFEHFLYGMHCARVHHQREQSEKTSEGSDSGHKEEVVSSSLRYGPTADPRAKILVKRQNLLRELKEKRDSLTYKLLGKVGRLPPLRQQQRSVKGLPTALDTSHEQEGIDDAKPVGTFVLMQNRKLSPAKRALEAILKKKHREQSSSSQLSGLDLASTRTIAAGSTTASSPRQKAKVLIDQWKNRSPRGRARTAKALLIADRDTADSVLETTPSSERTELAIPPSVVAVPSVELRQHPDSETKSDHSVVDSLGEQQLVVKEGESAGEIQSAGAYMLLNKEHVSSGKKRVLENLLKKKSATLDSKAGVPKATDLDAAPPSLDVQVADTVVQRDDLASHTDGVSMKREEDVRPASGVAPPKSPASKPALLAKTNLEKAMKKQIAKKSTNSGATPPS